MNILVTAGNTQTHIDKVRCITNIFSGKTGALIATAAYERGHSVTLITSHAEVLNQIPTQRSRSEPAWQTHRYQTFNELKEQMSQAIQSEQFDVVIHAAAVNDYDVVGTYCRDGDELKDVSAGKVKSSYPELWFRLQPTPKLVDKIRSEWKFDGVLVKFKLEVGISESELLEIAEQSRLHSQADLMVANTLEGMHDWAFIGNEKDYLKVDRSRLAGDLVYEIERIAMEKLRDHCDGGRLCRTAPVAI